MSLNLTIPSPTTPKPQGVTTSIVACRPAVGSAPSTIVTVRRKEELTGEWCRDRERWDVLTRYEVAEIDRLETASLVKVVDRLAAAASRDAIVLVDLSQVGRPFLRLVRERGINAVPVHDRRQRRQGRLEHPVPRADLDRDGPGRREALLDPQGAG
jgi:hypothetical protein